MFLILVLLLIFTKLRYLNFSLKDEILEIVRPMLEIIDFFFLLSIFSQQSFFLLLSSI